MHAQRRWWLLAALLGCGDAETGQGARALVNGTASSDSAVLAVIHTRPAGTRQLCTGALVAPAVVVTAKHCVYENTSGTTWTAIPMGELSVGLGSDAVNPASSLAVTAIATTAGPYHTGDGAVGGDIAVLTLASAPPGVSPVRIAREAPSSGDALRIVGFGYTGAGSTGTLGQRNEGTASIVSVAAGTFTSEGPNWTCTGDSGGPAFRASDGALLGVTSLGPRGCPASTSIYTRVDQNLDLLAAAGVPVGAADAGADAGASGADASPEGGALPEGGAPGADAGTGAPARGCGCGVPAGDARGRGWALALLLGAALRGRRGAGGSVRSPARRRA